MQKIVYLWKNYGLSITLATLFVLSWVAQWFFQFQQYIATQEAHNQIATVTDFTPEFLAATFENWQSEFLQLVTMVVLTSTLSHKGSPESKDSEEKTEAALARIEKRLLKMGGNLHE